jgi:hypothetical protein
VVVLITDEQTEIVPPSVFTPGGREKVGALGSGFVIDLRGDIVTNDHVVHGATDIRVRFGERPLVSGRNRRHRSCERPRRHTRVRALVRAPSARAHRLVER